LLKNKKKSNAIFHFPYVSTKNAVSMLLSVELSKTNAIESPTFCTA